ncbi:YwiC-like family protein [Arcanobacterium ihumii]|uniref:YwiC-like family protein n=1 Tax=Arcanobacterium ihumii TaxID=2138162 RepID=UPI001357AB59|nr:YwiC-like family protein [Arcanobacterium ihumii]
MKKICESRIGPRKKARRQAKGWVPNYHGAWAMVTFPILLGIYLAGFGSKHLILLAFWWVGYFAFFATGLWLRSKFNERYKTPTLVYGSCAGVLGVLVLIFIPHLLRWLPVFLPLVVTTLWCSWRRRDRSFLNNAVTVIAASLMLAVAYDVVPNGTSSWQHVWIATGILTAYFLGTVFYVKTNIRERNRRSWLIASATFHILFTIISFALFYAGLSSLSLVLAWLVATVRSIAVPIYGSRNGWMSAKAIGIPEIFLSIWMTLALI